MGISRDDYLLSVGDAALCNTPPPPPQPGAVQSGGGGGEQLHFFFFACQLRGQSCTLIIPLPHYDNLATFFFSG